MFLLFYMKKLKNLDPAGVVKPIEIILHKDVVFKKPTIFEGFSGVGLVGTISAQYIVTQKNLELVGHMESDLFPPVAVISKGVIKHPVRIYSNEKRDMIVIETEFPLPTTLASKIAKGIINFAKQINAKEIVCLEGIAVSNISKDAVIYSISTDKKIQEKLSKFSKPLESGIVMGVSASVLLESKERNFPATCLLAESHFEFPDGKSAVMVIKKLNDIYGLGINTAKLEKESDSFESQLKTIIGHAKDLKKTAMEPQDPSKMMYG